MTVSTSNEDADQEQAGRLSPVQPRYSELFGGTPAALELSLLQFCKLAVAPLPQVRHVPEKFPLSLMASPPLQIRLLQLLLRISRARRALEIGTFVGYTTLSLAETLPEDGRITTIEKGDEFAGLARKNFAENSAGKKVESLVGDATTIIAALPPSQKFDFVFLDGGKEAYREHWLAVSPRVVRGGLLVADDVLCQGDSLRTHPTTDKGRGTKQFVEAISSSAEWACSTLPVFNGILLAVKN